MIVNSDNLNMSTKLVTSISLEFNHHEIRREKPITKFQEFVQK